MITAEQVKELRDATGVSVMQCKKALEEAGGNMEKAIAILKKFSSDIASKKSERAVKAGAVMVKAGNGKVIMVGLHSETDFVAKNEDFIKLLSQLTEIAFTEGIEKMKAGAKELIDLVIQKTGENIQLGEAYEIKGNTLGNYVHNGKIAVVVSLEGGSEELAREIAMHTAAMKPEYFTLAEVNEEAKNMMLEVFKKELESVQKPEEIKQKMLEGKMKTYFNEKTLTEQPFIKNPEKTVGQLLAEAKASLREVKRYII